VPYERNPPVAAVVFARQRRRNDTLRTD